MIEKENYLKAISLIARRERYYASEASKTNIQVRSRKLWGYSDGMKECLKILKECCESEEEIRKV